MPQQEYINIIYTEIYIYIIYIRTYATTQRLEYAEKLGAGSKKKKKAYTKKEGGRRISYQNYKQAQDRGLQLSARKCE